MITQAWVWQFEDVTPTNPRGTGTPAHQPVSPAFTTQYDAEKWLGANWRELAATGVGTAKLMHRGLQATASLDLSAARAESARRS